MKTLFDLLRFLQSKGYAPSSELQSLLDSTPADVNGPQGTGRHLLSSLERDRKNIFKAFFGNEGDWRSMLSLAQEKYVQAEGDTTVIEILLAFASNGGRKD